MTSNLDTAVTDAMVYAAHAAYFDEDNPSEVELACMRGALEAALSAASHVVYLAHTMLFFPCGPNSFFQSPTRTALLRDAAGVITVSRYLQDYLQRWAGCASVVIPFPAYGRGPFRRLASFRTGTRRKPTVSTRNPAVITPATSPQTPPPM